MTSPQPVAPARTAVVRDMSRLKAVRLCAEQGHDWHMIVARVSRFDGHAPVAVACRRPCGVGNGVILYGDVQPGAALFDDRFELVGADDGDGQVIESGVRLICAHHEGDGDVGYYQRCGEQDGVSAVIALGEAADKHLRVCRG